MGGSVNLTHGHIDYDEPKTKIKAIYPHIVVSGTLDKPCYSIHWYDIEQETMICGYSSYKLSLVRKWLKECFEVVDDDIDNLINKLKKSNKNYEKLQKELLKQNSILHSSLQAKIKIIKAGDSVIENQKAEIERLQNENNQFADIGKMYSEIKAEAIKDYKERLIFEIVNTPTRKYECGLPYLAGVSNRQIEIIDIINGSEGKEMVGEE